MMTKIVDKTTKDLELGMYHDGCKERIDALIESKTKEVAQVKRKTEETCGQEHDGDVYPRRFESSNKSLYGYNESRIKIGLELIATQICVASARKKCHPNIISLEVL